MPRSWPQPLTSRPSTVTLPPEAVSSPMAMRSAVVLPQPDGPMSETISPSCTLKLTRLSACTVWSAPSMRNTNRFEMSCSVTSPTSHSGMAHRPLSHLLAFAQRRSRAGRGRPQHLRAALLASFSDACQRFLADLGINQLVDVAAPGELAERDHLILRPDQALDRNGEIGIDHARLQSLLVDEGWARVVGLGAGRFARQRDGLLAVGHRVAQGLHLRDHEADGVLAPLAQRLAGHERAE